MAQEQHVQDILEAFRKGPGYQRQAVNAALELGDEIVPHLVDVLRRVAEEPERWAEDEERKDHWYAALILAYLKDTAAHEPLLRVMYLPDEQPLDVFGDMVHRLFAAFLFRTAAGSFERVDGLFNDRRANPYCRAAAGDALAYAYAAGMIERQDLLSRLGRVIRRGLTDPDNVDFYARLAGTACDVCPVELMPEIRMAFEKGLINPGYIALGSFEDTIAQGEEAALEDLQLTMALRMPRDIHGWMSHWACFGGASRTEAASERRRVESASQKRQAKKRKNKRKAARASRKRKRR